MATRDTSNGDLVIKILTVLSILIVVIVLAIGSGIWWLESRFGANAAAMVFGGIGVVLVFLLGLWASWRIQKNTVDQFVDVTEIMANGDAHRSRAVVESLRIERVNTQAQARTEQRMLETYQRGMGAGQTVQRQLTAAEQQQAAQVPQWQEADGDWR